MAGVILMAVLTFNMLWALYTTFSKEKIMIQQGEGALPASTYSFLALRHITRMGLHLLALSIVPVSTIASLEAFKVFIGVLVLSMLIELVSAVIETLVRLIYFKIIFSKDKQE